MQGVKAHVSIRRVYQVPDSETTAYLVTPVTEVVVDKAFHTVVSLLLQDEKIALGQA